MTISIDTLLIASLMMAVFAAVATVGSSLFLGAGFERLRAGIEALKVAMHKMDTRVTAVEKQGNYFFAALHKMEKGEELQVPHTEQDMLQTAEPKAPAKPRRKRKAPAEPQQTIQPGV